MVFLWFLVLIHLGLTDCEDEATTEQPVNQSETSPEAVNSSHSDTEISTLPSQFSENITKQNFTAQWNYTNIDNKTLISTDLLEQNSTESENSTELKSSNTTGEYVTGKDTKTDTGVYLSRNTTDYLNETETTIGTDCTETGAEILCNGTQYTDTELNITTSSYEETSDLTNTTYPQMLDTSWMNAFFFIKHFDGWYLYNGAQFLFDFVPRFVHPSSSQTLVATFYDEDGAVMDMNGTSTDGQVVIFTSSTVYSRSYRFSAHMVLQLNGTTSNKGDNLVYSGIITLPQNSSFGTFHMQKGIEKKNIDEENSKTAAIIAIVACISFLFITGTAAFVCWVAKKGYLEKQHKHYRLFKDSAVTYETDAETVHI